MARFETPCQIASLFTGAALVAVLIIIFLNAEVRHRSQDHDHESVEMVSGDSLDNLNHSFYDGLLQKMSQQMRSALSEHGRSKREAEQHSEHRIRHLEQKILSLENNSQFQDFIINEFCPVLKVTDEESDEELTSSANYSDSVISFVDSMTKKLAPEEKNTPDTSVCELPRYRLILIVSMTVTVTTIFNILIFSCIKHASMQRRQKRLINEAVDVKNNEVNVIVSPYDNI